MATANPSGSKFSFSALVLTISSLFINPFSTAILSLILFPKAMKIGTAFSSSCCAESYQENGEDKKIVKKIEIFFFVTHMSRIPNFVLPPSNYAREFSARRQRLICCTTSNLYSKSSALQSMIFPKTLSPLLYYYVVCSTFVRHF